MPLFLPKEKELEWLRPDLTDEEIGRLLTYEMPSDQIVYDAVFSIRGRTPRPDGLPKNAPFPYPNLPALGENGGTPPGDDGGGADKRGPKRGDDGGQTQTALF
jgi:hypothetical protein